MKIQIILDTVRKLFRAVNTKYEKEKPAELHSLNSLPFLILTLKDLLNDIIKTLRFKSTGCGPCHDEHKAQQNNRERKNDYKES